MTSINNMLAWSVRSGNLVFSFGGRLFECDNNGFFLINFSRSLFLLFKYIQLRESDLQEPQANTIIDHV